MTIPTAPSKSKCEHGSPINTFCEACTYEAESGMNALMRRNMAKYTKIDMVNKPPHYTHGGIEAIDYIQAKLTPEEFAGYCKGNALKYISRAGHKTDAAEDTRKAIWYLNRMIRE